MYPRHVSDLLMESAQDSPVILLNGARQTGKSTLIQRLLVDGHKARYITLDDADFLRAAKNDPGGFIAGWDGPLVIDEVQRVPELFMAIKASVDRDRRPGRFFLTGSANILLLPQMAEFLTGRMEIHTLQPLSQGELEKQKEAFIDAVFNPQFSLFNTRFSEGVPLTERITRGGFPEAVGRTVPRRRSAWFHAYITTLLQRDVRDIADVNGLTLLPKLLSLLATRVSSLLNFSELARSSQIPETTLKRYLTILETAFLTFRLPPWSTNLGKRLVKTPKIFLTDTGLAVHLLGLGPSSLSTDHPFIGPLLENFVVSELIKQASWSHTHPTLYHFRTSAGCEVDILLEDARGHCVGIEVKCGKTVGPRDVQGLKSLSEMAGKKFVRGIILYAGQDTIPFAQNIHALPLPALWQMNAHGVSQNTLQ